MLPRSNEEETLQSVPGAGAIIFTLKYLRYFLDYSQSLPRGGTRPRPKIAQNRVDPRGPTSPKQSGEVHEPAAFYRARCTLHPPHNPPQIRQIIILIHHYKLFI